MSYEDFMSDQMDAYIKVMFGSNAVRVPIRMVVQEIDDKHVLIAGTTTKEVMFGSEKIHQYVLGDMVVRPHLVLESDHLRGTGIAGIIKSSDFAEPEEWIYQGNILLDALGQFEKKKKK